MLSVPIHKDVSEYKPKWFGGLTLRTLAALSGAVLFSVVVCAYAVLVLGVPADNLTWLCYVAGIPAALFGFWSPCGMPFEKFAPMWLDYKLRDQTPLYRSASFKEPMSAIRADAAIPVDARLEREANRHWRKLARRNSVEFWAPGGKLAGELTPKK